MAMSTKQKIVKCIDTMMKTNDIPKLDELQEELAYLLQKNQENIIRRMLKKRAREMAARGESFSNPKSVW